ncbi:MAG: flagellar protein FlaG [Thermodesulfobacteriota bacterium]
MDVSMRSAEVKGFGVPPAPAIEREDRVRPAVTPVASGGDSSGTALSEQALQGKEAQEKRKITAEEAARAVKEMQERLDAIGNTRLNFSLHNDPDAVVVQITDRKSGELLRQFPAEEALALRKKLDELVGLLFDGKA